MEKELAFAIITTVLYVILRCLEMKYIEKEWKPIRLLVRDTIMVFLSALVSSYIFVNYHQSFSNFFNVITDTAMMDSSNMKAGMNVQPLDFDLSMANSMNVLTVERKAGLLDEMKERSLVGLKE